MKHAIFSNGIFLSAPLNTIYWNVPILKNKEANHRVNYEGKYKLLRTGEKLITPENISPIYQNPTSNLKAAFPENFHIAAAHARRAGLLAVCRRTSWHAAHAGVWQSPGGCQGGRCPCQTLRAPKQPADGSHPSPEPALATSCHQPHPELGRVTLPRAHLSLQSLSPKKRLVLHSHLTPMGINAKTLHAQPCRCRFILNGNVQL